MKRRNFVSAKVLARMDAAKVQPAPRKPQLPQEPRKLRESNVLLGQFPKVRLHLTREDAFGSKSLEF